jgi:hypothetical protein
VTSVALNTSAPATALASERASATRRAIAIAPSAAGAASRSHGTARAPTRRRS